MVVSSLSTDNRFHIRSYASSDAPVLAAMFSEFQAYLAGLDAQHVLVRELPATYGPAYLAKTLAEVEETGGVILVAEAASQLVGFVVAVEEKLPAIQAMETSVRRPGRVTELYVISSHRDHGVGGRLLAAAEDWFRVHGCDSVRIEVFAPNQGARRFYQRHGYTDWLVHTQKML
jgi:GNAT superfamily N-acetyltransferase